MASLTRFPTTPDTPIRHAILRFNPAIIIGMCQRGMPRLEVSHFPLPADAEFVRSYTDDRGQICLVIRSEEFAEVEPGHQIPEVMLPLHRWYHEPEAAPRVGAEEPKGLMAQAGVQPVGTSYKPYDDVRFHSR